MLDKKPMREKSALKRHPKNYSKSSISLNSLESNDEEEIRTESHPQTISLDSLVSSWLIRKYCNDVTCFLQDTKTSESEETETESDDTNSKHEQPKPQTLKVQTHQPKKFQ